MSRVGADEIEITKTALIAKVHAIEGTRIRVYPLTQVGSIDECYTGPLSCNPFKYSIEIKDKRK